MYYYAFLFFLYTFLMIKLVCEPKMIAWVNMAFKVL